MQSSWSSNNMPQSQHDRVHPKFLANRLFEATRSETPMDSVTLWIYSNVYGKMKNDNFKNADGVVTEQDGLQTGLLLDRTEPQGLQNSFPFVSLTNTGHSYGSNPSKTEVQFPIRTHQFMPRCNLCYSGNS